MEDITPKSVQELLGEVLRSGIIDEPDLRRDVQPFMAAIIALGLSWAAVLARIIETYQPARRATGRLLEDRTKGLRAPASTWPTAEAVMLSDVGMLRPGFNGAGDDEDEGN